MRSHAIRGLRALAYCKAILCVLGLLRGSSCRRPTSTADAVEESACSNYFDGLESRQINEPDREPGRLDNHSAV